MTGINTNVGAILASTYAQKSMAHMQTSFERLSSVLQVNSAADNAAGLAVSNKMASQIRGLTTALSNTADGLSLVDAALSGMDTSLAVSQRIRELALQSHSGVYTDSDRQNMQAEVSSLLGELDRIAGQIKFNDVELLDGTYENDMRVGNSNAEIVNVTIENMGINKSITGTTSASGTATTLLSPVEAGSGTSSFDTPSISRAAGASAPVFLSSSTATGTSAANVATTSIATGVSVLDVLASVNATGTSTFNTPASSQASGTSTLNILTSTNATGTSAFNTPTQSTGTGTSTLNILSSANGLAVNASDNSTSSSAFGASERILKTSSTATGSSTLDLLSNNTATAGVSTLLSLLPSSNAVLDTGSASVLTPLNFKNANFAQGNGGQTFSNTTGTVSIDGWDIHLEQVSLRPGSSSVNQTIGGFTTPVDTIQPASSPGDDTAVTGYNGNSIDYSYSVGTNTLTLSINDVSTSAYGQVHGPYAVSESSLLLEVGDTVSFNWQGVGTGDAADVYAYLLDVDDGTTIELENYTHNSFGSTPVISVSHSLARAGDYKFVFIAGSYDDNGGGRVGSSISLSNLSVIQANPATSRLSTSAVTLRAQEASQVSISRQVMAQLNNLYTADAGTGTFSLLATGSDHTLFTIDQTGQIRSNNALLFANQTSYQLDVQYQASNGKRHIETVTLNLSASTGARTSFSLQEANAVTIDLDELDRMDSFVSSNSGGVFRMDTTAPDSNRFSIDSTTGQITANFPLDYDIQDSFDFTVIYRATDGREFTNQIILNIADTLTSTAVLSAEESLDVLIAASNFTSSNAYAAKEDGGAGTFTLTGTDAGSFYFDGANIRSTVPLRLADQETYSFNYVYTATNGNVHTEAVTLRLTEALQSQATLFANPSNAVSINRTALSKLNDFVVRDGLAGTFSLTANSADSDDYLLFSIDSSGNITSSSALNYTSQTQYNFDAVYTASDGQEYRESIILNLVDPARPVTTIQAEENQSLTVAASQFKATAAAASSNPGGTYRLTGADASLFSIDASGNVTASTGIQLGVVSTYNHRRTLDFNIEYLIGGVVNSSETVKLHITEALQSTSSFTADEADEVILEATALQKIYEFAARHRFGGTWAIDNAAFAIDTNGRVSSVGALDFDSLPTHTFNVSYTLQNGTVFTEAVTLNLSDTLTSTANITTEETQALTVGTTTLTASATFAAKDSYAGSFTLTGTDAALFSVDSAGVVTSTGPLLRSNKTNYTFGLVYTASGGSIHTETVNLSLTEALQSDSLVSAAEANTVNILLDRLTEISSFSSSDGANGSFQIAATGSDYSKFTISANGNITSLAALDFDTQSSYTFDVLYISSDSRTFSDTITLNLEDTLNSTANLSAEETDSLIITPSVLVSTAAYATKDSSAGTFSLSGADASLFVIDSSGRVTSSGPLRYSTQSRYDFNVEYTSSGGDTHQEAVRLNLTQAVQADASLSVVESQQLQLRRTALASLDAFANIDSNRGSFSLDAHALSATDFINFSIDSNGMVTANTALDYSIKNQYYFNVLYHASDGRTFTERVTLNLTDTLSANAVVQAEESDQIRIDLSQLTSSTDFAARHTGGTYSLATSGFDNALFTLNGTTITSIQGLRRSNKLQYELDLLYTVGSQQHREHITLDLTRFLQSQSSFDAAEANVVLIPSNQFSHLSEFAVDEAMNGSFSLTGTDAHLFSVNSVGDVFSANALDYDTQQSYNFVVNFNHADGRVFTETTSLSLSDTLTGTTVVSVEEATQVNISSALMTSLQSYAAKDGSLGSFSLVASGDDYHKFSIAADGSLSSVQELRFDEKPALAVDIRYHGVSLPDYTETVNINLTETTFGHTRSYLTSKEAGEIIILPKLNPYLEAFAETDGFQGSFFIAQSPYAALNDHSYFTVESNGTVKSNRIIDFEAGKTEFEFALRYTHSNGTDQFTDLIRLQIINDKRDDNNLALEDVDITSRDGARDAALLLEEVVVKVSAAQAELGAIQNRFQHNLDNLAMALLMTGRAQGRIIDADFARESAELAKNRILNQASTNMIANAAQAQKQILMLLD